MQKRTIDTTIDQHESDSEKFQIRGSRTGSGLSSDETPEAVQVLETLADNNEKGETFTNQRNWTTSRWELYAFYIYYIVCRSFKFFCLLPLYFRVVISTFFFNSRRFNHIEEAIGKQRFIRIQLRSISVPKPTFLGRI